MKDWILVGFTSSFCVALTSPCETLNRLIPSLSEKQPVEKENPPCVEKQQKQTSANKALVRSMIHHHLLCVQSCVTSRLLIACASRWLEVRAAVSITAALTLKSPRVCLCWAVKLDVINPVLGRVNQLPAGTGLLLRPLQYEPNGTFGGVFFCWRGGVLSVLITVV